MRVNGSTVGALRRQCPESSKTNLAMSRTNTSVKRWLTKRATTQLDCRTMVSAGLIAHLPMISSELHKTAESWALSRPTSCGLRLSKYLSTNIWAATRMKNRNWFPISLARSPPLMSAENLLSRLATILSPCNTEASATEETSPITTSSARKQTKETAQLSVESRATRSINLPENLKFSKIFNNLSDYWLNL